MRNKTPCWQFPLPFQLTIGCAKSKLQALMTYRYCLFERRLSSLQKEERVGGMARTNNSWRREIAEAAPTWTASEASQLRGTARLTREKTSSQVQLSA